MVEFGLLAPEVAFGFRDLHALSGLQPNEVGFELGHHGEDVEEQPDEGLRRSPRRCSSPLPPISTLEIGEIPTEQRSVWVQWPRIHPIHHCGDSTRRQR